LSELFEELPEAGDPPKPKLVFFFDEAHLLFSDAPKALMDKIEQVVRLIRSKGVGVYFITQSPADVPDTVLGQLGNRVQHALRAFTPRDQKAVKAAAETMRANPKLDTATAIMELAVGEALISFLDAKGTPEITERAFVLPPTSQIGPITPQQRRDLIGSSVVAGIYEKSVDRESAFEMLRGRAGGGQAVPPETHQAAAAAQSSAASVWNQGQVSPSAPTAQPLPGSAWNQEKVPQAPAAQGGVWGGLSNILFGSTGPRGGYHEGAIDGLAKSAARTVGSAVAREVVRGVLGSLLGSGRR
ncbi:MAG TPA: helicase HerA-like domain-containing protein, partial [Rhodopila sp.]